MEKCVKVPPVGSEASKQMRKPGKRLAGRHEALKCCQGGKVRLIKRAADGRVRVVVSQLKRMKGKESESIERGRQCYFLPC
jgi:hypothetical protein